MSRRWLCLPLAAAAMAISLPAPAASAAVGPCDFVGVPFVPDPAEKVCDKVTGAAGDVAMDVAGDAAKAITAPIFRQATEWVADGAGWLVGRVGALIDTTTTPRLDSRWFTAQYREMGLLATALALPLLFLAIMQSALARNPAVISRALAAVPTAFVLTGAAVAIIAALLAITDWACQVISRHAGPQSSEFFHDIAGAFGKLTDHGGAAGTGVALFVALLASILAALGAFAVWIELLIRSAGIYVCVLFFPTVLVARIWPKLDKWATRLAEGLTALILSKFVVVATLSLAAGAMAESRATEGFNGVLAAGALLVFAAFAPVVLFRLVQFAEVQVHARAGTAGTAARGTQTTMSAAQSARIAMDRRAAAGARTAGAVDMARRTTTSVGGTTRGEGPPGAQRSSTGGARGSRGGPPGPTGGAASGSARRLGDVPTRSAVGGTTSPPVTGTSAAGDPATSDRRPPHDLGRGERRPRDDEGDHE